MEMEPSEYKRELEEWVSEKVELLKQSIKEGLRRRKEGIDLRKALQWPELGDPNVEIFDTRFRGRIEDLIEPNKLDFPLL